MGQTCTCQSDTTFGEIYKKQQHLSQHLYSLNSSHQRQNFSKQLSDPKLNQIINIYNKLYLGDIKLTQSIGFSADTNEQQQNIDFAKNYYQQYKYIPLKQEDFILKKSEVTPQFVSQCKKQGYQSIVRSQMAVILMHGKVDNHIGYSGPFGAYDIGLDSACSIFQYFVQKLAKLSQISYQKLGYQTEQSKRIKIYILTNTKSKKQIIKFFKQNNYFGYGQSNIFFFSQQVYPVMDITGKVMLKSNTQIMTSTLGNGMLFLQLYNKRILQHLKLQQIKYLFIGNIEDVLLKIGDPFLLGYTIKTKKQIVLNCLSKFISDKYSFGYLGSSQSGRVKIYENIYKQPINSQYINSGSGIIQLDFIENLFKSPRFIDQFQNNKQIYKQFQPCYDSSSKKYEDRLCLFFEAHYHSIIEHATNFGFVEIEQSEFHPLKQRHGLLSPKTGRQKIWELHQKWANRVGYQIENSRIEFAPWISYDGQNIKEQIEKRIDDKKINKPLCIT